MKLRYQETKEIYEEKKLKKSESTKVVQYPQEPDYIKIYLKDICKLNDIPKTPNKILNELLKISLFGNRIILNATIKREIAASAKVNFHSIDNALSLLTKKKILKRQGTGVYFLNPYLFGKGDWRTIQNLRLNISYNFEKGEKTVSVKTTQKKEKTIQNTEIKSKTKAMARGNAK